MKKLLIISHVSPFPGESGQEQRVRNSLRSLRKLFHVTFLTTVTVSRIEDTKRELAKLCDEVICLDSLYERNRTARVVHKSIGTLYSIIFSLKLSNYVVGQLEFTPKRFKRELNFSEYDVVLYEYWHAHNSVRLFQKHRIPCIVDMHNLLWRSYEQQQGSKKFIPNWLKQRRIRKYRSTEERVLRKFDGIIAINREEESSVETQLGGKRKIFFAPMGIDLTDWPHIWEPSANVPRVAYYGGLDSPHNQQSAIDCYLKIMPFIWRRLPDAEFWIIGSNPPSNIRNLSSIDKRVRVTGYVENVTEVLSKMSVVVCPWQGRYGFRSRLIEVIAIGVPLVTTPDAIHGMELENNKDILLGVSDDELARKVLVLLADEQLSKRQSSFARQTIESLYSITNTYDRLTGDINGWLDSREPTDSKKVQ